VRPGQGVAGGGWPSSYETSNMVARAAATALVGLPDLTLTKERTSPFSRVTLVLARDPSGLRTFSVSTRVLESFSSNRVAVAETDAHAAVRPSYGLVSDLKGSALDCQNRLPGPLDCDRRG
jgi:hypothetical protein